MSLYRSMAEPLRIPRVALPWMVSTQAAMPERKGGAVTACRAQGRDLTQCKRSVGDRDGVTVKALAAARLPPCRVSPVSMKTKSSCGKARGSA
jgi:hypothetical protein